MRLSYFLLGFILPSTMFSTNFSCKELLSEGKYSKQDITTFDCKFMICQIETPAQFPGGMAAWKKYLSDSTFYPEVAYAHQTEGVAKIQFTISEAGTVTNVSSLNILKDSLTEEAIRVIKASPKWMPAQQNGKPVSYRFVQQITFEWQAQDDERTESTCPNEKSTIPIS